MGFMFGKSSVEVRYSLSSSNSSHVMSGCSSVMSAPNPVTSVPQSSFHSSTNFGFFLGLIPCSFIWLKRSFCRMRASVGNKRVGNRGGAASSWMKCTLSYIASISDCAHTVKACWRHVECNSSRPYQSKTWCVIGMLHLHFQCRRTVQLVATCR